MAVESFGLFTKILIGQEALLKAISGRKRIFIVTDKFFSGEGRIEYITSPVQSIGAEYAVFSDVGPDPDVMMVTSGMEMCLDFKPDTIIGFGGGSPIDCAKAVKYFSSLKFDYKDILFIAIPTTSGTGSEVSNFSVITDKSKGVKYPIVDDSIYPDYAVLDAELVRTVPPKVTADTGLDVLTHAIEAYVGTGANAFSDSFARHAILLVNKYLYTAYKEPNNMEARENMHLASCMAGAAFSNAGLGICHSMAHAMGAKAHIPHGRSNAVLLPFTIAYNSGITSDLRDISGRYAEIASIFGIGSTSKRQSTINLIRKIRSMQEMMQIPSSIRECGLSKDAFDEMLEGMTDAAMSDRCTPTNPVKPRREDIKQLYIQAFNGNIRLR